MKVENIKIYPCFAAHPPKAEKMEQKEWDYAQYGLENANIVLDSQNYLIDGYTYYLIARNYGLTSVPIRYSSRQIVKASHKIGGKLYAWELPGMLIDRVSSGEKLIVETSRGLRTVKVAVVEEYTFQEPKPFKMVLRKHRTGKKRGVV
ncbi:MAG: hypothetical protein KH452_05010 [Clostridiales bacterium]|nr:hypothetical protein [Clostridiales bacterium]